MEKKILILITLSILSFSIKTEQQVFLYWWRKNAKILNWGDELSPLIVQKIIGKKLHQNKNKTRMLALGSILHAARNNSIIWGTGRNGKTKSHQYKFSKLDVRAVRGPLTRQFLISKGIECPEVYGDPALLLPILFPELKPHPNKDYIIIPNLNEITPVKHYPNVILPTRPCMEVIQEILQAKLVISSSLHGIIVAEAFGIPARLIRINPVEPIFKYKDYYYATGRKKFQIAHSVEEALKMGGESQPIINLQPLIESFPYEQFN